jgi:hypothetical protein
LPNSKGKFLVHKIKSVRGFTRLKLPCRLKPFFVDEKFTRFKPVLTLPEALRSKKAAGTGAIDTVHR